jgi:hypothetical protein
MSRCWQRSRRPRDRGRPLRGPDPEGGGFAAAHVRQEGCRAWAGGRAAQGYGARKSGQAQACPNPGRGASDATAPRTSQRQVNKDELAFDSQKKNRNHKNPLTGSVHASRGLPSEHLIIRWSWLGAGSSRRSWPTRSWLRGWRSGARIIRRPWLSRASVVLRGEGRSGAWWLGIIRPVAAA